MSGDTSQYETALSRFSTTILHRFVTAGLLPVKLANTLVLLLIEFMTDPVDAEFLKYASRFLTPASYDDIVAERNVLHICGYPLCDKMPVRKIFGKQVPQISYKTSATDEAKPLPSSYLTQYCSKYHFQCSMIYRSQLSDEAVWARVDVAYLRNGTGEWEKGIKLLEELVSLDRDSDIKPAVEGHHRDLSESDVKQVMQSLSTLDLKSKGQDSKVDGPAASAKESPIQEMVRRKMQEEQGVKFDNSITDLQIAERDFERSRHIHDNHATAGPFVGSRQAIEGYTVGSAGTMKPPHRYVQWKERKEREEI
ncbi:Rtr1/RPAP2 family-domain-containing protein [Lipomyces kononenkoae]